jgi:hypothetical protein
MNTARDTTDDTMTLDKFITTLGIRMNAERTERNPHMDESRDMDHWRVTLRRRDNEDWCGELGYDPDSRRAERTFKAIEQQTEKLRRFLDAEGLDDLVYHTERL